MSEVGQDGAQPSSNPLAVCSPCPFCGHRDIKFYNDGTGWVAECRSCPCELRWFASDDEALQGWNKRTAVETSEPSPTWVFVERVATYSDYTHDDVDELKILYDLQAAAALLYGDGSRPERTIQQTGWWQCPCCQNYYTPERIVCPVSGDSRPAVNGNGDGK